MQFFLYAIVGEHWTRHMGPNHGITTLNKKVMMDRFLYSFIISRESFPRTSA